MTAPASHERVYRALLRLYPEPFRTRFADELVQLSGDLLRDARERRGGRGDVAATWLRLLLDLALTVPAEHLEQRRVARSLSRPASAATKALGVLGVAGGLILVSAFVFFIPGTFNAIRLVLFNLGAIAIAIAVYRQLPAPAGRAALVPAALVIVANAWHLVMVIVGIGRPQPPQADVDFRLVMFYAGLLMWATDGVFGLVVARLGGLARLGGAALLLGGFAIVGMDRLGLIHQGEDSLASVVALSGVALNGIGWIVLGIVVATRRRPTVAGAAALPSG
jgi:hypothetical protein